MIQKMRGTLDILPNEIPKFKFIEDTARKIASSYGYKEIRMPTFEATELFKRGVGETTDVVQKEMYTFSDNDGRSITLRPEGTAQVVRAIIEHGMCGDAMPLKLFYLINCFRYEAPQAGRSREFFQFGTEMFGTADASADATVIALASDLLRDLGLKGIKLHINSIGCPNCRPQYRDALQSYFASHTEELCDTCKGRLNTNPLRILDCKSPICGAIAADAPKTTDYLCPECEEHQRKLISYLDAMGIDYAVDPKLVRGLDYYTKTVFEFICEGIGAQSTVCGGGRYDNLVKQIGGPALPATGFAMGITRLVLAMEQCGVEVAGEASPMLYIAPLGDSARITAIKKTKELLDRGVKTECDIVGRSLKAQMKYADKIDANYTLIIGDSEIESGKAILKNMKTSEQREIEFADTDILFEALK